ncbi:hypothetical protein MHLP_02755 [Candidatus Mycoplasma haematolamae str. Purdue]|uniref:Lipoprotein n=1 Tax=Mycoplasma haematolamae (strain Purdue) TaxID=1212765 RepID=I7CFX6_MYCHA|nr:hypothetical protein [Candidatus Mycoplasma haematolamae]AFO52131.1 hypothetical protein MHLP_02755 [Candidatus Mycoplasma haematolamae str. Purdue]
MQGLISKGVVSFCALSSVGGCGYLYFNAPPRLEDNKVYRLEKKSDCPFSHPSKHIYYKEKDTVVGFQYKACHEG